MGGGGRTSEKRTQGRQLFCGRQTIANRPLPIAHCLAGEGSHRLAIPATGPLRDNGQWAMGNFLYDHGFRSVVLVILVNSFKISLQSVRIESYSLSSRKPPSCRRSNQNSVAEAFRSAAPISLAKTARDSAS